MLFSTPDVLNVLDVSEPQGNELDIYWLNKRLLGDLKSILFTHIEC